MAKNSPRAYLVCIAPITRLPVCFRAGLSCATSSHSLIRSQTAGIDQSGSSIYRRLVLGGDIAAIPEKLTLAGFSGLSAKAQHCFGARKRLVPVGEPCQALRGEIAVLKALTAVAELHLYFV